MSMCVSNVADCKSKIELPRFFRGGGHQKNKINVSVQVKHKNTSYAIYQIKGTQRYNVSSSMLPGMLIK